MAKAQMPYLISAGAEATGHHLEEPSASRPSGRASPITAYGTDLPPLLNKIIAEGSLAVPGKTVYIIGSDDPYGTTIADGLKESFTKLAGRSSAPRLCRFRRSPTGARSSRRSAAKPGVIVLTEWSPGSDATFFNQFIEQPTNSLLFEQYAPSIPEFNNMTHNKATGVIFDMLGGAIDSRPDTKEITAEYTKPTGRAAISLSRATMT